MTQRLSATHNLLTTLVFIALIASPAMLHLLGSAPAQSDVENRRLSPPPDLSGILTNWTGLTEEANAWMRDNFGLRRMYLKIGFEMEGVLRASSGFKAVRGDEGWLFNKLNGAMALHQGLLPFSAGEADAWLDGLAQVQQAAEASGATFAAIIAPNKHSIYPEFLSAFPRQAAGETRLNEVQRRAAARDLPLIDLRPVFKAAKAQDKVYFQTDSHWTDLGAYLAFVELRTALTARGADMPAIPRDALQLTTNTAFQGDLYRLLGEENGAPETVDEIAVVQEKLGPKAGSVLFIGDSFGGQFMKYLEATFEKAVFVDNFVGEPDLSQIRTGQYDVVIYEVVERYLSESFVPVAAGE